MANPRALLITLLVVASYSSFSHGYTINGVPIISLRVQGRLACSTNGNFNGNSPPLQNVNVSVTCNDGATNLGQGSTDATGTYSIVVKPVDGVAFDMSKCSVKVKLPIASCTVMPKTGTLQAPVTLLNIVPSTGGNAANFVPGVFVYVAA